MTIKELHRKLLKAYTVGNLNNISLTLINLFKARQYSLLQKISDIIGDLVNINIMDDGKGFSKFMMLYHPDRADYHINEINRLKAKGDFAGLLQYTHILKLERIEEIVSSMNCYEDIDYSPVYGWDMNTEGFSIIYDNQPVDFIKTKTNTNLVGYTFYDAMKIREYGHADIEYPSFYLEETEEFELSGSGINDLDGIQFCIHAKSIDLSNNRITDLTPISQLINLEDLNLADNQIGYLDGLDNLVNLKNVQLSNNYIEDISPLFELGKLEYADLSGNKIDMTQINKLKELEISVNFDF